MSDEKKLESFLIFNVQSPRDFEGEDWEYLVHQTLSALKETGLKSTFREIHRICDGCHSILHFRQTDLDFKCQNCDIYFDLCKSCQKTKDLDICPSGWGCHVDS